MVKKSKTRTKKQKPGPKEERLIINGDPKKAIDALLRKSPVNSKG